MSVLGFQIGGSLLSGAGSGAAAGASFIPGVGTALGIAQLGMGVASMFMGDKAAEQQAYNSAYASAMDQVRMNIRNQQAQKMQEHKIEMTKQQMENNEVAAYAAWSAEQIRLNEVYDRAAFTSETLRKQMIQTAGKSAAREVYGKSAQRGAMIDVLAAYGRSRAQLSKQLTSERGASDRAMEAIERQLTTAQQQAFAGIAVAPAMGFAPEMPTQQYGLGGFGTALKIGQLGLGAFQTAMKYDYNESTI